MQKRSLTIAGHRTSLALEPEFWVGLEELAASRGIKLVDLIIQIDEQRTTANLSSAVRISVLKHYQLSASIKASPVKSSG